MVVGVQRAIEVDPGSPRVGPEFFGDAFLDSRVRGDCIVLWMGAVEEVENRVAILHFFLEPAKGLDERALFFWVCFSWYLLGFLVDEAKPMQEGDETFGGVGDRERRLDVRADFLGAVVDGV